MKKIDIAQVKAFIEAQSSKTKIYLGADSERMKRNGKWYADYTLAIVVHIDGCHGCKIFGEVQTELDYDYKASKPSMRLMNEVYKVAGDIEKLLPQAHGSGVGAGMGYVANMLMSPDSAKETVISMNRFVINNFKTKSVTDVTGLRNPDLTRIKDEAVRSYADARIQEINNNIFPRDEDIISAAHLVYSFANEVTRGLGVKEIIFVNGTDTAWITGLIRASIEQQYGK
jgi:hypothetical protein